jgi:hypothetical protein
LPSKSKENLNDYFSKKENINRRENNFVRLKQPAD